MEYIVAIIDDDTKICSILSSVLKSKFTNIKINIYNEPTVGEKTSDIYFVDNFFGGEEKLNFLLGEIKGINPDALVIAMSGNLDEETVRGLNGSGCDIVWGKMWVDNENILSIISKYMKSRENIAELNDTNVSNVSNVSTASKVFKKVKKLVLRNSV